MGTFECISHISRQHVIFFKREIFFVNPLSPGTGSLNSLLFLNSICYKLARISTSVLGLCCCAVRMMCFTSHWRSEHQKVFLYI